MKIGEDEQFYGGWLNVDVEIHCYCGDYIQVVDEESKTYICKKCGREWLFKLDVTSVNKTNIDLKSPKV